MPDFKFQTDYLNHYLQMVEDTESPRIMHIWGALSAVSMALGRRCYLPFGTFNVYPNLYVLFVGTPGTRKSTAASMAKRMVKESTGVRFAPSDTGFQRQGLILALQGPEDTSKEYLGAVELGAKENTISSLTQLEEVTNVIDDEDVRMSFIDQADKHTIAIVASEFSRIVGQNNMAMMDFLGERYDGEDYEYLTKQTHIKLKNTLINMVACTTPVSIATSLPPQAGGQGFLSRIILVYGARKYKNVPRPPAPPAELVGRVKDTLDHVYYHMSGAFTESDAAAKLATEYYDYKIDISDSRFAYYAERRHTHLIKVAMCLAAASGRMELQPRDYEEADRILRATEKGMPDALGEFGLNPLAMLKQEILEQMRFYQGPLTMEQIIAMFHRDARSHEISEVINDLMKMGQVVTTQLRTGIRVYSAKFTPQNTEDAMMKLLSEK